MEKNKKRNIMLIDKENGSYVDNIVFVILKRTMKELRIKPHTADRLNNTLKGAVKMCGDSRKKHPGESYYQNIAFWPGDMGLQGNKFTPFTILFFARIITHAMPIDKTHPINASSLRIINNFNEYIYAVLFRVLNRGDINDEIGFLIKYGEEIGEAILACQDIGSKITLGEHYYASSQSLFFNSFYPKHFKEIQPNTFLI